MTTTAKISLTKALKLKNRLAGRLAQVTAEIQTHNCLLAEQLESPSTPNVPKLLEERRALVAAIVELKTAHYIANQGIQNALYTIGEKKGELSLYQGLNTHEGVQRHSYQNTEVKYVAQVKKTEADARCRTLESEIDRLQDEIEAYNASTKVEISQTTLDLGS